MEFFKSRRLRGGRSDAGSHLIEKNLPNLRTIEVPQDPITKQHFSITNPEYLKQWNRSRTDLKNSPILKAEKVNLRFLKPREIREYR